MENIQIAGFDWGNIAFILIALIFWIFRAIKENKAKQENSKEKTFAETHSEQTAQQKAQLLYQQKVAEYERLKKEKMQNATDEKKQHILTNYKQVTPSYQDNSLNYNQLKANATNFVTTPKTDFVEKTKVQKDSFKAYHQKETSSKFAKKLHTKNQLKEAFIFSEILKRKY